MPKNLKISMQVFIFNLKKGLRSVTCCPALACIIPLLCINQVEGLVSCCMIWTEKTQWTPDLRCCHQEHKGLDRSYNHVSWWQHFKCHHLVTTIEILSLSDNNQNFFTKWCHFECCHSIRICGIDTRKNLMTQWQHFECRNKVTTFEMSSSDDDISNLVTKT